MTSTKAPEAPAIEVSAHAPRKLTLAENIKLTVKVLGLLGMIGLALWGAEQWVTAG